MPKLLSTNGHAASLSPVPGKIKGLAEVLRKGLKASGDDDGTDRESRHSRVRRDFKGCPGVVGEVVKYLETYMVLPGSLVLVIAAWVIAAWLIDLFDRFPHLAVTSPEKRCGKTLLLDLLFLIVPKGRYTTNISPSALYRVIEAERPTLLMDESQSISRRGSEASEVIREILNAGIGRNAKVTRCAGEQHDKIVEFAVYSPKVFALIGDLDGVLADRCLPVRLERKTKEARVERYRSRIIEPIGKALGEKLEKWTKSNAKKVSEIYDHLEPFPIENDRMAELLLPLQAVLVVAAGDEALEILSDYATDLDERDREQETQTPGVRLLAACRELFGKKVGFMPTDTLIASLVDRREEPWHRWNRGEPMSREALANLLRPYGIRSARNKTQTARGYFAADFTDAWDRYLPPLKKPPKPANPAGPTERRITK